MLRQLKGLNMKSTILVITLLSVLTSCLSLEAPFCSQNTLSDIQNFEGNYSTTAHGTELKLKVEKKGNALYQMSSQTSDGQSEVMLVNTCQVNGRFFIEEKTEGLYTINEIRVRKNQMIMSVHTADESMLDRNDVTYTNDYAMITIDNSDLSASELLKYIVRAHDFYFERD